MAQTKAQLLGPVVGDVVMDVSTLSLDAEGNKVGIGTTGATATLHVFEPTEGDAVVQFNSGDNFPTVNRGLVLKAATGPTGYTGSKWIFDAQSSGGRIEFQTVSTPRLTILESGNIGINQTNPTRKLHITTASGSDTAGSADSHLFFNVADDGGPGWVQRVYDSGAGSSGHDGSFALDRQYSGSWSNTITIKRNNGNVGINDTTPDATLSVAGSTAFIDVGAEGGNRGKIGYSSNDLYFGTSSSSGEFIFKNNVTSTDNPASSGTVRLRIGSNGILQLDNGNQITAADTTTYIGLGGGNSTSNGANLFLYGGSHASNASAFVFRTNTTERLRITSAGTLESYSPDDTTPNIKWRSNDTNWFGSLNQSVEGGTITSFLSCGGDWSANGTTYSATKALAAYPTSAIAIHNQYNSSWGSQFVFLTKAGGSTTTDGAVSERLRIDSSGRLLINKNTNRDKYFNGTYSGQLQVEGTNDATRLTQFVHNQNSASQPILILGKSRGSTVGSYTAVQNGDFLGTVSFQGADGDEMVDGARIDGVVNGTPSNDNMPTDIVFKTNQAKERLRISNTGELSISGSRGGNNISDAILKFNIVNSNGDSKKAEIKAIKTADVTSELIFSTTVSHSFAERMRIGSTGCLNYGGNFTQTNFTAQITRIGGTYTDVMRVKGNTSNSFIRFTDDDGSSDFTLGADDQFSSGGFALYDRNQNSYRLSVDPNGNIGIGLGGGGAEARLHVEEDLSHSSTYYLNADAHILVDNPGSGKSVLKLEGEAALVYGGGSNKFFVADRQNERFRINEYGNAIYQGTISPNNGITGNAGFLLRGKTVDGSSSTVDLNISQTGSVNGIGLEIQEQSNNANALATLVFNHGSLKAMIASSRVVTNQWGTDLRFYTHPPDTTSAHQHKVYERFRITSSGNFMVGGNDLNYLKNEYRGAVSVTGTNNESFAFEFQGTSYGGGGLLFVWGTSGNVVINASAEILVNHSADVTIKSMSGAYTQARIRVKTDNNARAAVHLGRSGGYASGTTSINWRFIPYGGTYAYTTESTNSGTDHTHTTQSGSFRITAAGGGAGNVNASGSKNFMIDHPLESLRETTRLAHAAVEGPECNTIYRGKVDLVDGTATVNIDTNSRMTEGTFVALNQNVQCFTTNETGWTAIKGSVSGNLLTITAQDNTCTDTISWMVVGERHDQDIINNRATDSEGRFIPEVTDEYDPSQFAEYTDPVEPE